MKSILVAYDQNRGIGAAGELLWQRDLPADLRHFKELTTGHAIIMGRKTYDSIGRTLPSRQNIVVSRQDIKIDGVTVTGSLEKAYQVVDTGKEAFVIGGGEIYRLAMGMVDRIYATEVQATFDAADVFFPALDMSRWREASRTHHQADERNLYDYDFVVYEHVGEINMSVPAFGNGIGVDVKWHRST